MRVLLDECVEPAVCVQFTRHEAKGALSAGLTSLANGELLRAAEPDFDAFVTVDKGIVYQQNLSGFDLAFILLRVGSNRVDVLAPYVEEIEALLDSAEPGHFYVVEPKE